MAGLTAALSFARQGVACDIFEAAAELAEIGAGLQVSPNASRILARLDILPALERVWTEPERIALVSGISLKPIAHVPVGPYARQRWGAPYGVVHRATLQKILLAATEQDPLITIRLNSPLRGDPQSALTNLAGRSYPLIVGADGVWSNLRDMVPGSPPTAFSGNVAWRFTVSKATAPGWLRADQVTAFLGPSTHLVAYPLDETGGFNIVAIASGASPDQTWGSPAETGRDGLLNQFRRWNREIVAFLETALQGNSRQPTFWPLYEAGPGRWQNGGDTVLIGDAAHAMLPFAAQGASMAIEDGFILANQIAANAPLHQSLALFEAERNARVAKVKARGAFNRFAYHARGPIRLGRDLVLSLRPPQSLAADFDWLYGFKAE